MKKTSRYKKKINWISGQIRETKIQLNRQYKDLEDALKEQEKLRSEKKPIIKFSSDRINSH